MPSDFLALLQGQQQQVSNSSRDPLSFSFSSANSVFGGSSSGTGGTTTLQCNQCPFRTAIPMALTKHMLCHSTERRFSCPMCSYRCNRKAHLQQHIRKHTGEKPFKCNYCVYRTSNKSNLRTHEYALHKAFFKTDGTPLQGSSATDNLLEDGAQNPC